jgi:hypothetical protein
MGYDRNDVLGRTDLAGLCDELLGPRRGRGHSASWSCPDPGHGPQTGRTPPVTVFQTRDGTDRWRCHACGAGGTAIDLVMRTDGVGFREALDRLGVRGGAPEAERPRVVPLQRPRCEPPARKAEVSPALEAYVGACEAWLWGPGGRVFRSFLAHRGLGEDILRANRVGADPSPSAVPRADGLPRGGPAIVLPLLDPDGQRPLYLQARYLQPRQRKYDNPASRLVPASPRLGEVRLAAPPVRSDIAMVCEGIPDALIAAQAGWRSVAVLGAGLPDERVARAITERFPDETLVVAFDADHRGHDGTAALVDLIRREGAGERTTTLQIPPAAGDLNAWAINSGPGFEAELDEAISTTIDSASPGPGTGTMELDDVLETLAYQHLLAAAPADVARTVESITAAIGSWVSGDIEPAAAPTPGSADELLQQITYHHVLPATPADALQVADRTIEILAPWLDGSAVAEPPGISFGW